jgi:hypothetical protein
MRPGQPVTIDIDAYPERRISGHVDSAQPGSGTGFSLLPAQNATGNYVKIVQRVPVKIVMDGAPTDVALGPGMSVVPTVRIDPTPSLFERLRGGYERCGDGSRRSRRCGRRRDQPWLIAVVVALASFLEVAGLTLTGNRRAVPWWRALGPIDIKRAIRTTLQQRLEGLPKEVRDIAWKAQVRLRGRFRRRTAAGKKARVIIVAIAREMAAFLWAIGQPIVPAA